MRQMFGLVHFDRVNITLFLHYLLLAAIIVNSESRISPHASGGVWTNKCPCRKCDTDDLGRKRVICDEGGRMDIPTHYMDKDAQVILQIIHHSLILIFFKISYSKTIIHFAKIIDIHSN